MFEELLGDILVAAGGALIGALAGWAICTIVCTVYEKITKYNLAELIRSALRNSKEEKAKKILAGVIRGSVKSVEPNRVTIDAFLEDEQDETVRIKLETTEGVGDSVQVGMSICA